MPNVATLPIILLLALLWRLTGAQILSVVAFISIFSAASALDFGPMGVTPWVFALAAGLLIKVVTGHRTYRITSGINRQAFLCLSAFLLYAGCSSVAYPLLFQGVPVVRMVAEEPLALGMPNFAQLCYLVAAAVLYFIALCCSRKELGQVLDWYVRGCVFASLIAVYQLLNAITHIPYPSDFLYSNKAHVVYNAYQINGMWRLNSTFCEASEMACYLGVGLALTGWKLATQPVTLGRVCAFLLMLFSLLMTLSSVGYLCLAYLAVCGTILGVRSILQRGSLAIPRVAFSLLLALGVTAFFILQPGARSTVSKVVQSTLLEKKNTDSYRSRTMTHVAAIRTLAATDYMGAGWGSARASGLLYILLATVGIPGLLLFGTFLCLLAVPLFKANPLRKPGADLPEPLAGDHYSEALFSLSALLLAMCVAGAEPVEPVLWLLFGIVTVGREPGTRRSRHQALCTYPGTLTHNLPTLLLPVRN